MSTTLVFITTFLHMLVCCIGARILFHCRIQNIWLGILILALCLAGYHLLELSIRDLLYVNISAIVIFAVLLEGSLRQKILTVIKTAFIISCSIGIIEAILEIAGLQFYEIRITSEQSFLLSNVLLLLIIPLIGKMKQCRFVINRGLSHSFIIIAMGIMAVALVGIISGLHYAEPYVNNQKFSIFSGILIIISYFGIVVLGLFIFFTRNANDNYRHLLETEYLLRKLQKEHYEVLLGREEETRAFRHDLSNHILCLKELLRGGKLEEAHCYIDQMRIILLEIQKKSYTLGNEIIDAIINYNIHRLGNDVEISVSGLCNRELDVKHVELCSIISNPLQNAVEALDRQKQGKKYLNIHINSTQSNFQVQICNSFDIEEITKEVTEDTIMPHEVLESKKQDKRNHGIGLKNVKKLVEKNKGLFQIDIRRGEFRVTLILPCKRAATNEAE